MKKLTYDEVRKYVETFNCKLISTEYINSREKIQIECWCGNKNWFLKFNDFYNKVNKDCYLHAKENQRETRRINYTEKHGSFKDSFPEIVLEWDYNKNLNLIPEMFTYGSTEKIWWKCNICHYSWRASINQRTNQETNCPACTGRIVSDKNRLSILFPELVLEWSSKNNLKPYNFSYGSHSRVFWICLSCNFEWESSIKDRCQGYGCPNCVASMGEKLIGHFLNNFGIQYYIEYKFLNCRYINPLPFDFYLPDYNLLIEYDGILHYEDKFNNPEEFKKTKKRDRIKTKYCKDNNINLLRIPYWEFDNIEKILTDALL